MFLRSSICTRIALTALLLIVGSACAETPRPSPVPAPPTAASSWIPVTVRQLIDGPDRYAGQAISLTGVIIIECPEGCWFFLDDGTGKIYVDLKPANLTIPQKVGSRVELRGKSKGAGGNLQILGEEVRFLADP